MTPLTEDEWDSVDYFHNTKGDLTRWCYWDKFMQQRPTHPIVEAQRRLESAMATLDLVIKGSRP